MALRADRPWLPLPVFRFDVWLGGLIAGIALLALTSVFVFRGARLATVLGRTLAGIRLTGAMPGVYSSPVLLIASVYLLLQLWRTKPGATAIP